MLLFETCLSFSIELYKNKALVFEHESFYGQKRVIWCLNHTLTLRFLPRQLPGTAYRFSFLTRFFLGRFFEMLLEFHFSKNALSLQLFLKSSQSLLDIIISYVYLHLQNLISY